jgi:hypothetical protein
MKTRPSPDGTPITARHESIGNSPQTDVPAHDKMTAFALLQKPILSSMMTVIVKQS